jgi:hypothetical protein
MAETINATINMLTDSRQEFIKGAQSKKTAYKLHLKLKKKHHFGCWYLIHSIVNVM